MSYSPYQPPEYGVPQVGDPFAPGPQESLKAPAIALMIVAIISIALLAIALVVDVVLLTSGVMERAPRPPAEINPQLRIVVRMGWSLVLVVSNIVTLMGAIRMKNLESLTLARAGAILAVIPCLGPCCLLGIPFGIWALIVLSQPGVSQSFRS